MVADVDRAAARALAAQVWRRRARAELEAASRFSRLADELAAVGAVSPVVTMARDAASDERRHAEQCAALVRELGGEPLALGPAPPAREVGPRTLGARERVLYEVVAMSCITETLSAALLGELVSQAVDPVVRENMHRILRDEVDHARLGWAHLAAERERGVGDVIGAHLPAMLAGTVAAEVLFSAEAEDPAQDALSGLGALARGESRRIFSETMRLVVFPGLRRFGVETARAEAWLGEHEARLGPAV